MLTAPAGREHSARRRLASNFASLTVLQAANYLLPLIALPYLARVLGIERFGLVAFAQAFANYFLVLTEYGLGMWAAREISVGRDDPARVTEVVRGVIAARFLLACGGAVIALLVIVFWPRVRADWPLFVLSYGLVFAQVFYADWLFQGLEQMRYITASTLTSRVLFTAGLFVAIRSPEDYWLVPVLSVAGSLVGSVTALWVAVSRFGVKPGLPSWAGIVACLVGGWHLFVSRVFVSLYSSLNMLALGFFGSNVQVGYYAIAERIASAATGLSIPFNQTVYPFLARRHAGAHASFSNTAWKGLLPLAGGLGAVAVGVALTAPWLVGLVAGGQVMDAPTVLRWLAPTIVLGPLGTYFTQLLIIQGRTRRLVQTVTVTSLVHLALLPLAVWGGQPVPLAMLVTTTQALAVALTGWFSLGTPEPGSREQGREQRTV
jgi:polysaccharide transporter, PST family